MARRGPQPARLVLALALLSAVSSTAAQSGDSPPRQLIDLAAPGSPESEDIALLNAGKPIIRTLNPREGYGILFGVASDEAGVFPSILLELLVSDRQGDADIVCTPLPWAAAGIDLFPWTSRSSQGVDEIFLSSQSEEFQAAVTNVSVAQGEGKDPSTMVAAAFTCVVSDTTGVGSTWELELDFVEDAELDPEEQEAVARIFEKCCQEEGGCVGWPRVAVTLDPDAKGKEKKALKQSVHNVPISTDLCHQLGHVCDSQGRLTRMSLRGFGLQCEFPADEFSAFASLRKLDLTGNLLTGDAGAALDALAAASPGLTHLSLAVNRLTGSVDGSSGLCELATGGLLILDLEGNLEVGGAVPECLLGEGSTLLDVILTQTGVEGSLPDVLPADSPLEALHVAAARLSGSVPASLGNAQHLAVVDLSLNELTGGVPAGLIDIPSLRTVLMTHNKLSELPESWSDAETAVTPTLSLVGLDFNELEGPFPAALATAEGLSVLGLAVNNLGGGLPDGEGLFPLVEIFNVSGNKLEGSVPESWESSGPFNRLVNETSRFARLDMSNNELSGELPGFFFTETTNFSAPDPVIVYLSGNDLSCDGKHSPFVIDIEDCRLAGGEGAGKGGKKNKKNKKGSDG
ncbi:unnamed protein product [Ostreobium quekettii]|uniref:Uncharacterized protein n=1 Tax=Ostreobium quekettii TaxID=121088 RepID=A0A8S1ILC1_9CHLO|nr:unnamed protein product [Ostreobium quekettii]|eukprot:evm.model.scf_280EXC.7 EVM.evm.TU.scf_280EXC.7   scf_280EXC:29959-31848(+)